MSQHMGPSCIDYPTLARLGQICINDFPCRIIKFGCPLYLLLISISGIGLSQFCSQCHDPDVIGCSMSSIVFFHPFQKLLESRMSETKSSQSIGHLFPASCQIIVQILLILSCHEVFHIDDSNILQRSLYAFPQFLSYPLLCSR